MDSKDLDYSAQTNSITFVNLCPIFGEFYGSIVSHSIGLY